MGGGGVGVGERSVFKKTFFGLLFFGTFEPQFGLKIRGGGAGPLPWTRHCTGTTNHMACGACVILNLRAQDLVEVCHILQTGLSHGNEVHKGEPMDGNLK